MTAPVCRNGCGRPAVATVMAGGGPVLTIRTDRTADPRTAQAWADRLHCWECVGAAVDAHLTGTTAVPDTGSTP